MPCMGDNLALSRPRGLRQLSVTSLVYHSALAQSAATARTHSHNGQTHLFSNSTKNTKNNFIISEQSVSNKNQSDSIRMPKSDSKNDSAITAEALLKKHERSNRLILQNAPCVSRELFKRHKTQNAYLIEH